MYSVRSAPRTFGTSRNPCSGPPPRCRSWYSFGYGSASPAALVDRAAELGHRAVVLTDIETLAGQPAFHARARERDLIALSGVELRGRDRVGRTSSVVLIATDDGGWEALCRTVSRRRGRGSSPAGDPLCDIPWEEPGILVLTSDARSLERMVVRPETDRSRLRALADRDSGAVSAVASVASRHRLPVLEDRPADLAAAAGKIATGGARLIRQVAGGGSAPGDAHMHIRPLLPADPRTTDGRMETPLAPWARLLGRCTLELGGRAAGDLPSFSGMESSARHLTGLAGSALADARAQGRCRGAEYGRRLERELAVFRRRGLEPYLLLVHEVVRIARRLDLPLTVRGSAASSLVLHLMGASPVDPVEEGLLFERFLNPGRRDLPDVDLEVCSRARDALVGEIAHSLGRERVAHLATYPTLGRRGVLATLLPALGVDEQDVRKVRDQLPPADLLLELGHAEWEGALVEALQTQGLQRWAPVLQEASGVPTHLSLHASGMIVTGGPVMKHGPVVPAPKGVATLEFDGPSAEWLGLVKLDVLGSRSLTQLRSIVLRLRARDSCAGAAELERVAAEGPSAIPSHDTSTLAAMAVGETVGCPQLESPPVRRVLTGMRIHRREDLAPALAVVRPGAGSGRVRSAFLRRVCGRESPTPPHPALQETLSRSHGLLLFEDDIIRALSRVARISLDDADRVRVRLQDLSGDPRALRNLEQRFLRRVASLGEDVEAGRVLWAEVERFAAYSFNRAHAATTAMVAWWLVWLRSHAPEAFACAVLDDYGGSYPLRSVAAAFARSGVSILPPSATRSTARSRVEEGVHGRAVRLGLERLTGISRRRIARMLEERERRPYRDLEDLIGRMGLRLDEVRTLLFSGALDGLSPLPQETWGSQRAAFADHLAAGGGWTCFPGPEPGRAGQAAGGADRSSRLLRIRQELETLRMHPSGHPMEVLRGDAESAGAVPIATALHATAESPVRVAGVVAASRRRQYRKGLVHFVTLEDESGILEVVLRGPGSGSRRSGGASSGAGRSITTPGPYLVEGRIESRDQVPTMEVTAVLPFHHRRRLYHPGGRDG